LIKEIILEEKNAQEFFNFKDFTVRWKISSDLGLVFVAAYKEITHLKFVDTLLGFVQKDFISNIFPTLDIHDGIYKGLPVVYDKQFLTVLRYWEENTCKAKKTLNSPTKKDSIKKGVTKSFENEEDDKRVDPKE
jgi:hypothetical protein